MFVQGPRSPERAEGGLGIGLALVRNLTVLHGGIVEAYSDGPGRGSSFVVRLPRAAGAASELPRRAPSEPRASFAPEIAILDIGLPVMDGYELGAKLRAAVRPAPALIALTGYGQGRDRRRSVEAGFDVHLVKPLETTRLLELPSDIVAP